MVYEFLRKKDRRRMGKSNGTVNYKLKTNNFECQQSLYVYNEVKIELKIHLLNIV
jgi:hypothetical protein